MRDKVAIVTGAGDGIGLAIARRLVGAGASVVINDISSSAAREARAELHALGRESGGRCEACVVDVAAPDASSALVGQARASFGGLDLVALNAGVTLFRPFLETTAEDLGRLLSVNLRSSFQLAQQAAEALPKSGGSLVFTSSVVARRGHQNLTAYGMTKAAIEGLVRSLAIELAGRGIRVNAVLPGATLTPRNLKEDPSYAEVWNARTPLGRVGQPEDPAAAAFFLLSDDARHVTGQSLVVDGGWSMLGSTEGDEG